MRCATRSRALGSRSRPEPGGLASHSADKTVTQTALDGAARYVTRCARLRVLVQSATRTSALDYAHRCARLRVPVQSVTCSGAYGYVFGCVLSPEALSRAANHHVSGTRRTVDYLLRVSCAPSRLLCSGGGRAIALAEGWPPGPRPLAAPCRAHAALSINPGGQGSVDAAQGQAHQAREWRHCALRIQRDTGGRTCTCSRGVRIPQAATATG